MVPGLNLLTGPNGSGKTNILEGINIVSDEDPLNREPDLRLCRHGTADLLRSSLPVSLTMKTEEIIKLKFHQDILSELKKQLLQQI